MNNSTFGQVFRLESTLESGQIKIRKLRIGNGRLVVGCGWTTRHM